jgi:YgiT-type zinc finger domain-containing protein
MEWKAAPFQVDRKGYHLTLEAVPAWVCRQCGEPYFEEREVDRIQDVIRQMDQRTEELAVCS